MTVKNWNGGKRGQRNGLKPRLMPLIITITTNGLTQKSAGQAMDDKWQGATPRMEAFEGLGHHILIQRTGFSSAVSLTEEEARSLHRWLFDRIAAWEHERRTQRIARANGAQA